MCSPMSTACILTCDHLKLSMAYQSYTVQHLWERQRMITSGGCLTLFVLMKITSLAKASCQGVQSQQSLNPHTKWRISFYLQAAETSRISPSKVAAIVGVVVVVSLLLLLLLFSNDSRELETSKPMTLT
jgi:hypothetical protein